MKKQSYVKKKNKKQKKKQKTTNKQIIWYIPHMNVINIIEILKYRDALYNVT